MSIACLACGQALSPSEYTKCHGLHEDCFLRIFELKKWDDFLGVVMKYSTSSDPLEPKKTDSGTMKSLSHSLPESFFHGKFKKYQGEIAGRKYIFKVKEENVTPELPDVEYLSNQIAQTLGIPVAWFTLLDYCGVRTFVTRNFISDSKVASTLTHLYHYFSENQPYQCEPIIAIISGQTGKFKDVETFINMCLFDALIGNHDRHGRNIGLITTSRQCKLAPIYDNPSWLGLECGSMLRAQFSPTGRIETYLTRNPVMKDYVTEFLRLGYETTLRRFAKRIDLDVISRLVVGSTCSPLMKEAILRLVRERAKEITHALL